MDKKELLRRYTTFLSALFITAFGVALVTRSYLGASPISGLPYVWSLFTPLSMGTYIFILNMLLIVIQMALLGTKEIKNRYTDLLTQIPVSLLFGLFIDIAMWSLTYYAIDFYALKILSLVVGSMILAIGISLEVIADVTMLSAEYTIQVISKRFDKNFGNVKMCFDLTLVVLSIVSSLAFVGRIEGIREGTILAALITGPFVKFVLPKLGFIRGWQQSTIENTNKTECDTDVCQAKIITITREYGSNGHKIGEMLSRRLNLPFYDNELIALAAKESGLSEEYVSEKEQNISNTIIYQMVMQDYGAPLEKSLSKEDALFVAQSRVIRRIAMQGACIIVGRCADYILKDFPNCINIFLHADEQTKVRRAIDEYGVSPEDAKNKVERTNHVRAEHYAQYTNSRWGDYSNYTLNIDTSVVATDHVCNIIENLYKS